MKLKPLNIDNKKELKTITFLIAFFTALIMLLPNIIAGQGIFTYMGDYNAQQIPFYVHCHRMVREGAFASWDWNTELGANFLSSYSYYNLCSPFFWLTLPFPTSWVPYLMGPLLMLKFACAALTGYIYIRRYVKRPKTACLGGLLYAFSGWSIYNIFFNQFHESLVVFPLLLWALDELVENNKKGIFGITVFLAAVTNYFFFFGMVIYVVLYWLIKTITHSWEMNFKKFLLIFFESVTGVMLSAFILLPTALAVLSMPRMENTIALNLDLILYNKPQLYLYIIQSMFFPAEIPALQTFFTDTAANWSSVSLYLPFVSLIGVITWISKNLKKWQSILIYISLIMAFVPMFNMSFVMFKNYYYARWFFMPLLIMSMITVKSFEEIDTKEFKKPFFIVFISTLLIILISAFCPNIKNGKWVIGFYDKEKISLFLSSIMFSVLSLLLFYQYFLNNKKKIIHFSKKLCACILMIATLSGSFSLVLGRTATIQSDYPISSYFNNNFKVESTAEKYYRTCSFKDTDNMNLYLGTGTVNTFHSIATKSTFDFYEILGYKRTVSSPATLMDDYAYNSLLSVKYVYAPENFIEIYESWYPDNKKTLSRYKKNEKEHGTVLMPGYKKINKVANNLILYKNENYIPMGTTYDYYVLESDFNKLETSQKTKILLKALLIKDEEVSKYRYLKDITQDYDLKDEKLYTYKEYKKDCEYKNKNACSEFNTSNNGFTAKIKTENNKTLFFSIPYEIGWKAYINGKETNINIVNGGLMAISVQKGENNIEFKYETPGFKYGLYISLLGVLILICYICYNIKKRS